MLTQDPDQVIAPSAMTDEQLVTTIENRMSAAHLALQSYFLTRIFRNVGTDRTRWRGAGTFARNR
jgi:hypothetical protein